MNKAPYVRNAPLLCLRARPRGDGIELVSDGSSVEWLPMSHVVSAQHLATTWNFHDPLVDALRGLLAAPADPGAIEQAQHVLGALDQAEHVASNLAESLPRQQS